jgi:CheY-like chemotaxis protein
VAAPLIVPAGSAPLDRAVDKVNILLIDDQPAKLLSYEVILAELGENLIKANSPQEALGILLRTEDVAVVLIDVVMPGIDGFQLAAMIRASSDWPSSSSPPSKSARPTTCAATKSARSTTSPSRSCPRSCAPRFGCSSTCTARPASSRP